MNLNQLMAITGAFVLAFLAICLWALYKARPQWFAWHMPAFTLPRLPRFKPATQDEATADSEIVYNRARMLRSASDGGGDPDAAQEVQRDTYFHKVETRLDQAFTLLERDKISLDTYRQIVAVERNEAARLIKRAEFGMDLGKLDSGRAIVLDDVQNALIATDWCLDWIKEREQSTATPADPEDGRDAA